MPCWHNPTHCINAYVVYIQAYVYVNFHRLRHSAFQDVVKTGIRKQLASKLETQVHKTVNRHNTHNHKLTSPIRSRVGRAEARDRMGRCDVRPGSR